MCCFTVGDAVCQGCTEPVTTWETRDWLLVPVLTHRQCLQSWRKAASYETFTYISALPWNEGVRHPPWASLLCLISWGFSLGWSHPCNHLPVLHFLYWKSGRDCCTFTVKSGLNSLTTRHLPGSFEEVTNGWVVLCPAGTVRAVHVVEEHPWALVFPAPLI